MQLQLQLVLQDCFAVGTEPKNDYSNLYLSKHHVASLLNFSFNSVCVLLGRVTVEQIKHIRHSDMTHKQQQTL